MKWVPMHKAKEVRKHDWLNKRFEMAKHKNGCCLEKNGKTLTEKQEGQQADNK